MTTERQMVMMYAAQQKVITALLNETGDADLAARLERCLDGSTGSATMATAGPIPADPPAWCLVSSGNDLWMVGRAFAIGRGNRRQHSASPSFLLSRQAYPTCRRLRCGSTRCSIPDGPACLAAMANGEPLAGLMGGTEGPGADRPPGA